MHVITKHPVTNYEDYNYGESYKIIDIGMQPLWIPTNAICEAMNRDLILKEELGKIGLELRFHNYLKGADVNNYILSGDLEAGVGGDMSAITISAEFDMLILVLIQHSDFKKDFTEFARNLVLVVRAWVIGLWYCEGFYFLRILGKKTSFKKIIIPVVKPIE